MNWIIVDSVLFVVAYLVWTCASAYRIASYESGIAVRISDKLRAALLIFSFKWPKISVMAVIYQIFTYVMLGFYLVSRLDWAQSFLKENVPNINQIYTWALLVQVVGVFLLALLEEGIYYLRVVRKR